MTKLERMKAAAAQGKGSAAGQRKSGKPRLKTPLMPGMGRPSLPENSPVEPTRAAKIQARDKEMDDRGRWPEGTFATLMYNERQHEWCIRIRVPINGGSGLTDEGVAWEAMETGGGLHQLITDTYRKWLKDGKPGAS